MPANVAVLLTGLGYIGAALTQRLAQRGERVVALENFYCTPREAVLRTRADLIEGDVADPADVARLFDAAPDATLLFHLAAQPSASVAANDPDTTERTNLTGARLVLERAARRGIPVVFGGSFRVYGDELESNQIVDEQTPYGRVADLSHLSKIYIEQLARMLGGAFVSVRLGVAYGVSPIMKTAPAFMTVPNLFCKLAACGEDLHVLQDRPLAFIHVADAAEALLFAADRLARSAGYDVVNAAPEVMTVGQLARTVQRLAQARGTWARLQGESASEAGFQVASRLDGFEPKRHLAEALGEVLDYFLNLDAA
jgi:nucleoside-diphosphate-sugar epimerase